MENLHNLQTLANAVKNLKKEIQTKAEVNTTSTQIHNLTINGSMFVGLLGDLLDILKFATPTTDGIMKKEDKLKLDAIEAEANKYIHPNTHPAAMIVTDTDKRFVTDSQIAAWDSKAEGVHDHNSDYYTKTEMNSKLSEKAEVVHGHHIPQPESVLNPRKFLSSNNTYQLIPEASVGESGLVRLDDSNTSVSLITAPTSNALKKTVDLANTKLPMNGGTMTGPVNYIGSDGGYKNLITIETGGIKKEAIATYAGGNPNGDGMIIASPGAGLSLFSGESFQGHKDAIITDKTVEDMILASDQNIRFISALQDTFDKRHEMLFDNTGLLSLERIKLATSLEINSILKADTNVLTYKTFDILHTGNFTGTVTPGSINAYTKEETNTNFVYRENGSIPIGSQELRLAMAPRRAMLYAAMDGEVKNVDEIYGSLRITDEGVRLRSNMSTHIVINTDDIGEGVFRVQHGSGMINLLEVNTEKMLWKNEFTVLHSGILDPKNVAPKEHGIHLPTLEVANDARYLRNDNTWQTITAAKIKALDIKGGTLTGPLTLPSGALSGLKLGTGGAIGVGHNNHLVMYTSEDNPETNKGWLFRTLINGVGSRDVVRIDSTSGDIYAVDGTKRVYHTGNFTPTDKLDKGGYTGTANDLKVLVDGKAPTVHGHHIPEPQVADDAKYLRNDNTWQVITPDKIGSFTKEEVTSELNKKAPTNHGNHVPDLEAADNTRFLRNDGTFQVVTPNNIGAVNKSGDTMTGPLNVSNINSINSLRFNTNSTDEAEIRTLIDGTKTYLDYILGDDPGGNDKFRWLFQNTGDKDSSQNKIYRTKMELFSLGVGENTSRLNLFGEMYAFDGTKKVYHEGNFTPSTKLDKGDYTGTASDLKTLIDGKAPTSHGSHIPTPETEINNTRYLRSDNSWQTILPSHIGTYNKNEIDNLISGIMNDIDWKEAVATKADIETTYPNPQDGWTVNVKDTNFTYRYNGTEWISISSNSMVKVTADADGLMSKEDKVKLDGIESNANNYTHPSNHAAAMITTTSDRRFVTDAQITKWDGKANNTLVTSSANGLMTKEDKVKLDSISPGANNYVHPDKHNASMIETTTTMRFVTDAQIEAWDAKAGGAHNHDTLYYTKSQVDAKNFLADLGNVTAVDGSTRLRSGITMVRSYNNGYPTSYGNVLRMGGTGDTELFLGWSGGSSATEGKHADNYIRSKRDTVGTLWSPWAKIYTDKNLLPATTTANGLITKEDKVKLDGIAANANNYTHPSTHGVDMIVTTSSKMFVSQAQIDGWDAKAEKSVATTTTNGLMSNTDKTKLDGIAVGANNYSHPSTHSADMITTTANKQFVSQAQIDSWGAKANAVHDHNTLYYSKTEVNDLVAGKANTNHGVHVPGVEVADNKRFLRNDNTWQTITAANIGAMGTAGGIMTGILEFTSTSGTPAVNKPTALSYGYLGSYGNLKLLADTDSGNTNEYVQIAASEGNAPTVDKGLVIKRDSIVFKGGPVYHSGNLGNATSSANGLMSNTDKAKLDGISANANNYVHPSTHPASIIVQDANNKFVTDAQIAAWNAKAGTSVATQSANGLMSNTDKTKLDGIAANANNYTHPSSHSADMISTTSTKRFVSDAQIAEWDKKIHIVHDHNDIYYTKTEMNTKLDGKANSSHGNHVPTLESANNTRFLRNDNTWQTVSPSSIGALSSSNGVGSGNFGINGILQVGPSADGQTLGNSSVRNHNGYLEIVAPANSSHNSKTALIFHHRGTSTSCLEYKNTDSNNGYFNFKSDDTGYTVKINDNEIYHTGNLDPNSFVKQYNYSIVVNGDSNTYYPVAIPLGAVPSEKIVCYRGFSEQAPDNWNTPTHKGGLFMEMDISLGGWGGMEYYIKGNVYQTYSKIIGNIVCPGPATDVLVLLLRGGGARYNFIASRPLTITVHLGTFDNTHTSGSNVYPGSVSTITTPAGVFNNISLNFGYSTVEEYQLGSYRDVGAGTFRNVCLEKTNSGNLTVTGNIRCNTDKVVWHTGNFDPGSKAPTSGDFTFSGKYRIASDVGSRPDYHTSQLEIRGGGGAGAASIGFHRPGAAAHSLQLRDDYLGISCIAQGTGLGNFRTNIVNANAVYGAVWNDYAEFFRKSEGVSTEPGDILALNVDDDNLFDTYKLATEEDILPIGVHSDTFGILIGGEEAPEASQYVEYNSPKYSPVGLAGRVKVKIIGKSFKGMKVVPSHIPGVGRCFDKLIDEYDKVIGYLVESDDLDTTVRRLNMRIGK
ncbi:MAG: tail fiber protein [Peptostreptococcaceae bacterium]